MRGDDALLAEELLLQPEDVFVGSTGRIGLELYAEHPRRYYSADRQGTR